jgi:hypothetical protein
MHRDVIIAVVVISGFISGTAFAQAAKENTEIAKADFTFDGTGYFHRYTKNDLLEYTPKDEKDLNAWSSMVTVNYYRKVKDGEGLANVANSVLANYQAHQGVIVKTDSVPRTKDKPAEHLVVVIFPGTDIAEIAFTRFLLQDGVGMSVVYSHRIYGKNAGEEMKAWHEKNGPAMESNLMKWDSVPRVLPAK